VVDHIRRRIGAGTEVGALPRKSAAIEETRRLILNYGWNATAYQLINPGIDLWFSGDRDAVIGYVRKHHTRVVAGAPVCSLDRLPSLVEEWEALAARRRDKVCYFGAAGRIRKLLQGCAGYSTVVLGSQPVWNPQTWAETVRRMLRAVRQEAMWLVKGRFS
jgi:phosphatidylglycerol lysyltransferase